MDPDETKKVLAENNRKITVLRVNEKSLTRQCTTLLEMERHLRKENEKLKGEITHMETAVTGKIGKHCFFKGIQTDEARNSVSSDGFRLAQL